jgi:[ribosomal protein S5]-alanine N-acetyltransferase
MPEVQRVRPDHGPALLAFELENRAYFAASISDRGDDYFAHFDARHRALLAEQAAGVHLYHVLVEEDGTVVGRINLFDVTDTTAAVGFRIAEKSAGRGLAQHAVLQICDIAVADHGLTKLLASAAVDNAASRAVLARTGFVPVGETVLNGRPGITFARDLS